MKTVMISAGESSGEWYGSMLTKELKRLWPDVRVFGIGGERMNDAGVELLSGISSGLGITEILPALRRIRKSFRIAVKALSDARPDVVVLIDYPDFNFRLGKAAKKLGLKVLYYVSPQVWAWRRGRVKTMGEIADKVAVILPFEEEIYRNAGIPCEFVGHPAMEEIEHEESSAKEGYSVLALRSASRAPDSEIGNPVIALLPGSRPNELKTLLPIFAELVRRCKKEFPDPQFLMPLAPNLEVGRFADNIGVLEREGVRISKGDALRRLASSDVAVIASGTATLQAALLGVPSVVVYKLSALTYSIGKALVKVRHISLVNIIAGEEVVRELIQHSSNADEILKELKRLLTDIRYRRKMVASMNRVREIFSGRLPSRRVAAMIGDLTGWTISEPGADFKGRSC